MKLRILGSGTSTGVPEIGCKCAVCTSTDPHDNRLRASSLIHTDDDKVILVDCGPDFREQMLRVPTFERIDGVLITHEHYDHVGGLDDLRPFCRFGDIPIYADAYTAAHLRSRMPYCFVDKTYPGVPKLTLHEVEAGVPFYIGQTQIVPLAVIHGKLPILGYRIGEQLGYITDMTVMPEASYEQLHNLDLLVLNALRVGKKHPTHQNVEEALVVARRIGARQTYFIHMSHGAGLHTELERMLPPEVQPAYDGMEVATQSGSLEMHRFFGERFGIGDDLVERQEGRQMV
ncbi:MAG: MBL fold metallo-hydrolase [Prevotellaceae bacterium]|jgi:phosphoribosyl 1,2-cyclic phosphate phosphodiesterase|nr:MBL fold metallo-hydrolase [Prevotellaceae bacterium]